ncbi:ATP-binding cassette domain-containing protein [Bordetella petrii]|nr:ATP-binding cassette domain-containing protein [Bordetella petrii]
MRFFSLGGSHNKRVELGHQAVDAPTLQIEDVSLHINKGSQRLLAVSEVSLTIKRGEIFALVGESGSGKSLIARAIMRLLPPDLLNIEGTVRLCGEDIMGASHERMRQLRGGRVSMIFQEPMASLNPLMRVGAQIAEAMATHSRMTRHDISKKVLTLLKDVRFRDAEAVANAYPHELSGGMRQRIMIAIALANDPALLIADEPTTALDVTVQREVMDIIVRLQKLHDLSVLFISHDLALVAEYSDRIGILYGGVLVEEGGTRDVIADPAHPYTSALLDCVPRPRTSGQCQSGIDGAVPPITEWWEGCRFAPRCKYALPDCREGDIAIHSEEVRRWVKCNHPIM